MSTDSSTEVASGGHDDNVSRSIYWNKARAAVYFSIAILGVVLFYFAFVRTKLDNRYRDLVRVNLQALRLPNYLTEETNATIDQKAIQEDAPPMSESDQLRAFETTILSLKRLIHSSPHEEALHLQQAIVYDAFADWYKNRTNATKDAALKSETVGDESVARNNAYEAMLQVEKLNGKYQPIAVGWIVQRTVIESVQWNQEDAARYETQLRDALIAAPDQQKTKEALALILIEKATRPSVPSDYASRKKHLQQAFELLSGLETNDTNMSAAKAIAALASDKGLSKELASETAGRYWSDIDLGGASSSDVDSVFECMALSGALREAQLLISDKLNEANEGELGLLRHRFTDSAVKLFTATLLTTNEFEASTSMHLNLLMSLAIQLGLDSPELHAFFDSLLRRGDLGDWVETGSETWFLNGDQPLEKAFRFVRELKNENASIDVDRYVGTSQTDLSYRIFLSRYLARKGRSGEFAVEKAIAVLTSMVKTTPELYSIWFDLVSLNNKAGRKAEALEALRYLDEKLPDNGDVKAMIKSIETEQ